MKSKLIILGVTAGLLGAAQIGMAQNILAGTTSDATPFFAELVVFSADNATAPDAVIGSADLLAPLGDNNFSKTTVDVALLNLATLTLQDSATTATSQQLYTAQAGVSSVTKNRSQSGDNSYNWAADGQWMSIGTSAASQNLAATSSQDSVAMAAWNSTVATVQSSSVQLPAQTPQVNHVEVGHAPDVAPMFIPEPNTVGLLIFGGSTLLGGKLFRRKQ